MDDLARETAAPLQASRAEISARLTGEARALAERVGAIAERLRPDGLGLAGTAALLDRFKEAWTLMPAGAPRYAIARAPLHPLDRLQAELALSPFEVDVLLLAGLCEEHEAFAAVLSVLHPRGEPRASVALAAQLFCRTARERVYLREVLEATPTPLRGALRLGADAPLYERSLLVAPGLWPALHGFDVGVEGLAAYHGAIATAGLHAWLERDGVRQALRAIASRTPITLLVTADSEDVAFARALALVEHAGARPRGLQLDGALSPDHERSIVVHAVAQDVIPVLRLGAGDGARAAIVPSFEACPRPVVVATRQGSVSPGASRALLSLPVERLSTSERTAMWVAALPELASSAAVLASRYTLEPFQATDAVRDAHALGAAEKRTTTLADVTASIRARSGLNISPSVNLVRPRAGWEDLVLQPDRLRQLREAVARLDHQARVLDDWGFLSGRAGARGVRMLFAGPSGTGKTLSAEVMAGALGVDLLCVDISRVVSKWIGETEKNLSEVFDVAERAQAVLFFDEADALFGRRTEAQDAHDRYANLETAYLLSRLERFEGLAVLATNMRQAIDSAFLRRIEFVIDFEEPGAVERETLWRRHIPGQAPLAPDVDFPELAATYPIVGGLIRNAAVAAGFLAAAGGGSIGRQHILHAIRREYEKSGRAFPGFPSGTSTSPFSGDAVPCPPH